MGVINATATAATAAVGYDLLSGNQLQQVGYERVITALGFTGSTAAGDCGFDLYVDTVLVGQFVNTDTGVPNRDDMFTCEFVVPANSKIIAKVNDAAASNPVYLTMQTAE